MIRTVKFLRILSILFFLGVLTLVYAYLPVMVQLTEEYNQLTLHKENFFYFAVAFSLIVNIFLLLLANILLPVVQNKAGEDAAAWWISLAFVINVYLGLLVGYIGVINNPAHVSSSGFAYLNYLGPVLLLIWIIGFFYLIVKKKETA